NFFLLLNVLVMALTGCVGVRLFYKGMVDMAGPDGFEQKLRLKLLQGGPNRAVTLIDSAGDEGRR
ncbi:MAG: hypothetical protein AAFR79_18650, partial [Pseudomonadota bacterium]